MVSGDKGHPCLTPCPMMQQPDSSPSDHLITALWPKYTLAIKFLSLQSTQGRIQESALGGHLPPSPSPSPPFSFPPSFPLPSLPLPSFPLSSRPFPSHLISFSSLPCLPLEVGPLFAGRESGGALKLPQRVRAEPGRQTVFGEL